MVVKDIRYLRQRGSGFIYIWTPKLALRADMVEYDPGIAKIRIEALKKIVEEKRSKVESSEETEKRNAEAVGLAKQSAELTSLENELRDSQLKATGYVDPEKKTSTPDEMLVQKRSKIIADDPEIKKIQNWRTKNQAEEYMLVNFGETVNRESTMDELKTIAMTARTLRIFEKPIDDQDVAIETNKFSGE